MTNIVELKPAALMTVVTMRLGRQMLAIPASALREILDPLPVTRVPTADRSVSGVINVRGAVVPLAELRFAFGIPEEPRTDASKMLVVEVELADEPMIVAISADAVLEVTELDRATMEALPPKGSSWPHAFVQGVFRTKKGLLLLPNLSNIFASLASASGTAAA
ncbi:chemotaxis protein CheW [Cereibacter azotoformans]|uniref:Purine-binding chemotaxis protein CheW n=2 Tax=Cereibacter TaxID=1653176 RepID=A0A2T5KEK2_9RHOB|nr:chemotaxis protein CheW [Cereibacter azotoformans]AXQ92539.1 chemotaxis protein CheW [Cereibacter sphaeroides]MBO4169883.1 chemotaxis protein CheW [Cereibacter azotoformans]PTR20855.1 purine-binding chemotaxis protein CheW [Cereibacter azotoformans]UIJ30814.1 chemotaxis protein CheW [Cereibacter azotoformans]ULB08576.1 chemotaxis protein CheW [Cereibacter azotoformans]